MTVSVMEVEWVDGAKPSTVGTFSTQAEAVKKIKSMTKKVFDVKLSNVPVIGVIGGEGKRPGRSVWVQ